MLVRTIELHLVEASPSLHTMALATLSARQIARHEGRRAAV